MSKHRILLFALLLMLSLTGLVVANSSENFAMQRFVALSGGSSQSSSFTSQSVIGQPSTTVSVDSSLRVSTGFLLPLQSDVIPPGSNQHTIFLPIVMR